MHKLKTIIIKVILWYFKSASSLQLKKYRLINPSLKIIGISGSSGKTGTMNAIYAVLKDNYKVKYSYKANSETGIPLDILGFKMPDNYSGLEWLKYIIFTPFKLLFNWSYIDVYIVEMGVDGISEPKNMKYLLKIIIPDIAVYLNVDSVHGLNYEYKLNAPKMGSEIPNIVGGKDSQVYEYIETVKDNEIENSFNNKVLDIIAKDKNLLISKLPSNGLAILNKEDPRVLASKELAKCEVIEVDGSNVFDYVYPLPKHYNLMFEIAMRIAIYFKIPKTIAMEKLQNEFKLEPGRSSLFKGIHNSLIIDSSYNSAPVALKDLIDYSSNFLSLAKDANYGLSPYFENINAEYERIAILGDMRELGKNSQLEHERVALHSINKIDRYFLIGPEMEKYFKPILLENGISPENISHQIYAKNIIEDIKKYLKSSKRNKIVLVKGSQNNIFLEIIVKELLKDINDEKKLCRRGKLWDNIRAKV